MPAGLSFGVFVQHLFSFKYTSLLDISSDVFSFFDISYVVFKVQTDAFASVLLYIIKSFRML